MICILDDIILSFTIYDYLRILRYVILPSCLPVPKQPGVVWISTPVPQAPSADGLQFFTPGPSWISSGTASFSWILKNCPPRLEGLKVLDHFRPMLDPCAIRNYPTWSPKISVQDRHHRTGSQLRRMSLEMESPNLPLWMDYFEGETQSWYSNLTEILEPWFALLWSFSQPGCPFANVEHFWELWIAVFLLYHCQTARPSQIKQEFLIVFVLLFQDQKYTSIIEVLLPLCLCPNQLIGQLSSNYLVFPEWTDFLDFSVLETTLHILDASLLSPLTPDCVGRVPHVSGIPARRGESRVVCVCLCCWSWSATMGFKSNRFQPMGWIPRARSFGPPTRVYGPDGRPNWWPDRWPDGPDGPDGRPAGLNGWSHCRSHWRSNRWPFPSWKLSALWLRRERGQEFVMICVWPANTPGHWGAILGVFWSC